MGETTDCEQTDSDIFYVKTICAHCVRLHLNNKLLNVTVPSSKITDCKASHDVCPRSACKSNIYMINFSWLKSIFLYLFFGSLESKFSLSNYSSTPAPDIRRLLCRSFFSLHGLHKLMFAWWKERIGASQYPNRVGGALSFSSALLVFLHLPSLTRFSQHLTAESEMEKEPVKGERGRCTPPPPPPPLPPPPQHTHTKQILFLPFFLRPQRECERCHVVGSSFFLKGLAFISAE